MNETYDPRQGHKLAKEMYALLDNEEFVRRQIQIIELQDVVRQFRNEERLRADTRPLADDLAQLLEELNR